MTNNPGQFQPGEPKPENSGRRAGTPNKNTARIRAAMADTSEQFIPLLSDYMLRLATTNPHQMGAMQSHEAMMQVLTFLCDRAGVNIPQTPDMDEEGDGI